MPFQKGHQLSVGHGRPKGSTKQGTILGLQEALRAVRRRRPDRKDFLYHFIEQAYKKDEFAKCLFNKLVPNNEEGARILLQNLNNIQVSNNGNGHLNPDDKRFTDSMREHLRKSLQQLP